MSNWNIDETPYPGPYEQPLVFQTHIWQHAPSRPPEVGQFFFNSHGQCLGLVLAVDQETVTLHTQGIFK